MAAGDLSDLIPDMWRTILDKLDTVTVLLMRRVCTEVCVIVEDYLIAAKEVRIDLEVLVRMRSRRPWLVPRDEVVYNVLQFEQCAMVERNNVGNYEYQLIHEPEYRGALQCLDTGAVLKKLLRVSHRKISIFRSLGRTQEDHPSYDFRDWIWCFGDWYTNCQGRPLKILLDGITIDLRFFLFKIVDRKDGNGNMLFSSVEVRNLTILGGITPPFREGDQRWWGFHPDFVVNIGIDHLSLKRDGRQEKLELELYACIQENYENPMTQELRNELLIFGDEKFGHGGQGRKRFRRIVRLWRRLGLLGGGIGDDIVDWNDVKELVMSASDFVKWSFAKYVEQLIYEGEY